MNDPHPRTSLPTRAFPILPLRKSALFPGTTVRLDVGRPRSLAMVATLSEGAVIGLVPQREAKVDEPGRDDLHDVGTLARVVEIAKVSDRAVRLTVEGLERFALDRLLSDGPYPEGEGHTIQEVDGDTDEASALAQVVSEALDEGVHGAVAAGSAHEAARSPARLADRVASALGLDMAAAVSLLGEPAVPVRLRSVLEHVERRRTRADLRTKLDRDVRRQIGKTQRELILREQLKAIQKELGEGTEGRGGDLRQKLDDAELPEEVQKIADRELERLDSAGGQGMEANVIRTYLEWLADLPWSRRAEPLVTGADRPERVRAELDRVAEHLDRDHEGLGDVKERILEQLAVQGLSDRRRGTLMCLAGPPGVGKTSLGESIAEAMGRPFVRIALGGVRDEAEVRGHRRTYVGALPGRIIHALRKAKVKNPVILLDEIDKLGTSWAGNPEAALLEVLDPEQNGTFTDHYLETSFDLSEVMFLCTANQLDHISAPLRDRLEVIELSGYTQEEKIEIARRHLVPKRERDHGLPEGTLELDDDAVARLIQSYTREAGVRQLDRQIAKLCRAVALSLARSAEAPDHVKVDVEHLEKHLGKPRFESEVAERTAWPGVATGLAWTPTGGDILFVESSRMPGKGRVEITGQLGDVMKESARAALTYVRSHAGELDLDLESLDREDLHIHVPAGAVPKDGPSAGVTMFTALASLLSGRRVRPDTAMTGECTLRGRVLPVGGIKSKLLAAHRAGIRRVLVPRRNERDLADVPDTAKAALEIVLVDDMSEVLAEALIRDADATALDPTGAVAAPANDAAAAAV